MKLSRVPGAVRAIATPERRVAWGLLADGSALVATGSALYDGSSRLAWTDIERVGWSPPVLTVVASADVEGAGEVRSWEVVEDSRLAETVHTCVLASVVWSERRVLVPSGAVRLVARREAGASALAWQVVWEPGTDRSDPALRAQAEAAILELRKTIG